MPDGTRYPRIRVPTALGRKGVVTSEKIHVFQFGGTEEETIAVLLSSGGSEDSSLIILQEFIYTPLLPYQ